MIHFLVDLIVGKIYQYEIKHLQQMLGQRFKNIEYLHLSEKESVFL